MAVALVGSAGAVSLGATGAAVTPAWGTGESRTAGNLLVCWVGVAAVATAPSVPTGWSSLRSAAGTSCASRIFYKTATGSDAAPTIAGVTSGLLIVRLAEFSGCAGVQSSTNSASGTTSPLTVTNGVADSSSGCLVLYADVMRYSSAVAATASSAQNNATDVSVGNSGTSVANHYVFGHGITTSDASADSQTLTFSTSSITGAVSAIGSFVPAPVTGTASFASTSTLSASTVVVYSGVASLATTDTPSASANVVWSGQSALAATASLTATGSLVGAGSASLATTGTLSASGNVTLDGASSLSTGSSLAASGVAEYAAGGSLDSTSSLVAVALVVRSGAASLVSTAALAAAAAALYGANASLSSSTSLAAVGMVTHSGVSAHVALSDAAAYSATLSDTAVYGILLSDSAVFLATLSDSGVFVVSLSDQPVYEVVVSDG